ncbi:MAG: hypothetical protein RMI94_00100 [Bryobacterales bacterium]|nr:hypothetical protein [Bryobacteraceae bacterium]MDW8128920.1 hypothetical protein [Bryobacterales bacterium]
MRKFLFALPLVSLFSFAQYRYEPAGPPPEELAPAIREALQKTGHRIVAPNGSVFAELWFRAQAPTGPATAEEGVSLTTIPHGSLVGAIRFPGRGADRRGQAIKPGVYTLRLAYYPVDGAHQGVAPQRDFLKIIPASEDKDLNATPSYDELVAMSNKASGTSHPAILSVWKLDKREPAGLVQHEGDWVLHATIGDIPIGLIIVGTFQG